MFVLEGETVDIPRSIERKNSNAEQARGILNRLSGLSSLGMDPQSEGYAGDRTSFRDLMAFTFQPQNIVANPDILFFKADTTEHREKLKAIFPYVLNAVTQQTLEDRWELDRLQRVLRQREALLNDVNASVQSWVAEAISWLQQAKELGLLPGEFAVPSLWPDMLTALRRLSETNYRVARPALSAIEGVLKELEELRKAEDQEATTLSVLRQRLLEIKRLVESSRAYGEALHIQRDRLALSDWFRTLSAEQADALAAIAPEGPEYLSSLCEALDGVELEIQSRVTISDKMDKEQLRLRRLAEESITRLNDLRSQIRELERRSEEARVEIYRADQIERYLGRLEHAITLYEKSGEDAELTAEVNDLKERVNAIKARVSEREIQRRIRQSLTVIENIAGQIIPTLDAEWRDAAINLIINDLTLKVIRGTRDDYLWEIGSGANWLAYHIAVSLALQRFFLKTPAHPVPSFLMYDQPSQAYFPQRPRVKPDAELDWQDEDIEAVRKVFAAVSYETVLARGNLQVIILDHAGESVWGDIENTVLVAEWRDGRKLVPVEWLSV